MIIAQSEILRVEGPDVVLPGTAQFPFPLAVFWTVIWLVVLIIALLIRWYRSRRNQPAKRPIITIGAAVLCAVSLIVAIVARPPEFYLPTFPAIGTIVPENSLFRRQVTSVAVHPDSDRWISALQDLEVVTSFGGDAQPGINFGIPFNIVTAETPLKDVDIHLYPDLSYLGQYPITDPAYIESFPGYGIDNHYLAYDPETNQVWELWMADVWFGRWRAGSGALWDLNSLELSDSSTIASRLPLLPGTMRYESIERGEIDHVILGLSPTTLPGEYVWPSRSTDGTSTDPNAPPMGAWMRLKADVDLSELGPQATIVARALQQYGMIISDTGGKHLALRGTPDSRWDRLDMNTLGRFTAEDFEFIDSESIMVDANSMEVTE